jgi:Cd2+/Zn2+-exporting ATPase
MAIATAELPVDLPYGGACASCIERLRATLAGVAGVAGVAVDRGAARLTVSYDADRLTAPQVRALAERTVAELERGIGHATLRLTGLDCADCAATVERGVGALPGVLSASVNFMASTLAIEHRAGALAADAVEQRVRELGYGVERPAAEVGRHAAPRSWRQRYARFWPTGVAALLWLVAFGLGRAGAPDPAADLVFAAAIAVGGWRIARAGVLTLIRSRTMGIDLLMTIAVVGAALIGEWAEGAAVVVLFALGEALEGLTADRARHAIRALMDLAPREASRKTAAGEERVAVEALAPGDRIAVRPGEQIAADGRVTLGATTVNQAAITGESLPVARTIGDEVFAGTLNERGYVEVEVTKRAEDTTLARIIHLVEAAQAAKAPSQRFVDRFARWYTPAVVVAAALVAIVPPLLGEPFTPWLYRALTLLVIACPCALVISTPVAIVAGIARASRAGVLIKGGVHLEALGGLRAVAFDKTGTLTEGHPSVTDVRPLDDRSADEALALAAAVESRSEHPLAGAILAAAGVRGLAWAAPTGFEALPGRGARAVVDGKTVVVGGPALVAADAAALAALADLQAAGMTTLLVEVDGRLAAIIAVADRVRPGAAGVVVALKATGIRSVAMLTGDARRTAEAVARQVSVDAVRAELLPAEKQAAVAGLLAEHGAVAMVGDGVNDAPALATATVGVAMGAAGSDTALETADVALMADDLTRLPFAIRLGRAALATIWANIGFAVVVKALFLALTLVGLSNLWLAILADTGAALLVIANSMRLLRFPDGQEP